MFLLVIVAVLTFYQFSTGQVTTARMRLVNATDAAAYSAGLWRARAFNYYAYSNRAIIFNEVAIAQTATLVSYGLHYPGRQEPGNRVQSDPAPECLSARC